MLTFLPENSLFLELPHSALRYCIVLPLPHPAFYIPYLATVTAARGLASWIYPLFRHCVDSGTTSRITVVTTSQTLYVAMKFINI